MRSARYVSVAAGALLAAAGLAPATAGVSATAPGRQSEITSTNLPTHVEVGTRPVVIHDTVTTRDPANPVQVTLKHPTKPGTKPKFVVRQLLRGPATHFAGRLSFAGTQVPGWGRQNWELVAALPMHTYDAQLPPTSANTPSWRCRPTALGTRSP